MKTWQVMGCVWLGTVWLVGTAAVASAQSHYPRVYGPTGRPYGPTQAHYQYERQYGHPWHGMRGSSYTGPREHHIVVPVPTYTLIDPGYGFGSGFSPWSYPPGFPPNVPAAGLQYQGPAIVGGWGIVGTPGVYLPYPSHEFARDPVLWSAPLEEAWQQNQEQWGVNLPEPQPDPSTRPTRPASTADRLKSLEARGRGDAHMRKQEWALAYVDYRKAIELAPDDGEGHWRLGICQLVMQHYELASAALKRAVHLRPELAESFPELTELLGPDSSLLQSSVSHKIIEYVRADIRDPDRLFLCGVWLTLLRDTRATEVFEAGLRLAGRGNHFSTFLQPRTQPAGESMPSSESSKAGEDSPLPLPPAPVPATDPASATESSNSSDFSGPELLPPT